MNVPVVKVGENLISLLLKLHSNLSGVPDSFVLEDELAKGFNADARIGDGPFFIGKLLKRLALADDNCRHGISGYFLLSLCRFEKYTWEDGISNTN